MSVTNLFKDDDPTIASRYLAGQLTEPERAAFEADLESDAATLNELEATARLKVGLARLRENGELDALLRPTSTFRQVLIGLAATVTIAVIAISFIAGYVRQSTSLPMLAATPASFVDAQGRALPVAATVAVFTKRAAEYDALVELPADRKVIALRALPQAGASAGHYRVSLGRLRADGVMEHSESVMELTPADDGFVTVYVDTARLAPGRYRMALAPSDANADPITTETFILNLVRTAQ